ncbi:methyltransferase domain-containing protein [Pseudooceanicola sp.]|uniref:methyltransferase domain-containing protein n=1 Tax=Pseudooceanicola sp. TaxID=1914328 RepID=UPI0026042F99|nr:methyltransferase domain-containing protein [Pseudooceanicola sp.]MDF1856533.1 methyltransferase domain-containing protein [Pseudooceanicola sp.]
MSVSDWNPESYSRFAGLRLRPALDLLARVGWLPAGDICDLGCGTGVVGPLLATRFPDRRILGVDASPAMLDKARDTGAYSALTQADITEWRPEPPAALIYSNAALHWLPDHPRLLAQLASRVAAGGMLAVQVPHQNRAPSHRIWLDLVAEHFPGRIDPDSIPGVLDPTEYHHLLAPLGRSDIWETEYYQILPAAEAGHPVRHFTSSTFARPILDRLDPEETAQIETLYDAVMDQAYPRDASGQVLFPFRRLFFTLDIT